jgi:hypothetical protein
MIECKAGDSAVGWVERSGTQHLPYRSFDIPKITRHQIGPLLPQVIATHDFSHANASELIISYRTFVKQLYLTKRKVTIQATSSGFLNKPEMATYN